MLAKFVMGALTASLLAALSTPAVAGHWNGPVYTYSGQRQSSNVQASYGPFTWPHTFEGLRMRQNDVASASTSGTISAAFAWVSDSPGDDPPATVNIKEVAFAQWSVNVQPLEEEFSVWSGSGSVNCGLDTAQVTEERTETSVTSRSAGVATTVDYDSSSGVVTCSVGLGAQVSGSTSPMMTGAASVNCGYTVSIYAPHPHPANFREFSRQVVPVGILLFNYRWDSTSGRKASDGIANVDLDHIYVGEYVRYPGNNNPYIPSDPPFAQWSHNNPTIVPQPSVRNGNQGEEDDAHMVPGGFRHPHSPGPFSYTATQRYRFHCDICMSPDEYQDLTGPLSIIRTVRSTTNDYENGPWEYSCLKSGLTATKEIFWLP